MELLENIKLSLRSIRGNLLRTVLTILIIAFGIMALVGILTSIDGIKNKINSQFSLLGSNTFSIMQSGLMGRRHGDGEERKLGPNITYEQAKNFKERYNFPAKVSVSINAISNATLQAGSNKTNPNLRVLGVDENYLNVSGYEIGAGRFFTDNEIKEGINNIILGIDIVAKLFPNSGALGQYVNYGSNRYMIVGILKPKGSSFMSQGNNQIFIPLLNVLRSITGFNRSVALSVQVNKVEQLNQAVDEATGMMRTVRSLKYNELNDFDMLKSDAIASTLLDNIKYITLAATLIGFVTLFGAAIGLMNIMLVSVTERTREIGVSKALGATKKNIRMQFLIEAIVICQLGGLIGIALGILIGNLVSLLIGGAFLIPWLWMIMGIIFCFVVGLSSGIYPAIKASNLDPIEALRYE